jgi:hypothetical protein
MAKAGVTWVKDRYGSMNANNQSHSRKVDLLGRGAPSSSTDIFGRKTVGGSRKPKIEHVLGGSGSGGRAPKDLLGRGAPKTTDVFGRSTTVSHGGKSD